LGKALRFFFKCTTLRGLRFWGLPELAKLVFLVVGKVIPNLMRGMFVKLALTGCLVSALLSPNLVQARQGLPVGGAQAVAVAELPAQGQDTFARIHQGGPFAYDKDGVVFGNRERLLPAQKRGYYREYTVKTPGSRDRGTRRIICGGQPRTPDVCYYTADHYGSFRRIAP
jgi:ribonuclease T1